MQKEMKTKWLAALRSGKYEQGRMALHRGGNFCCLGVLCDISARGEWKPGWRDGALVYATPTARADSLLPASLLDEFTIDTLEQSELVGMNDRGDSFTAIADWIEANL